ncbi:recombination regulator RecX [Sutcliffiella rhizosphaerae]|uniref:Regulatory protein RecX n=1 Tax=Sutcliffiella rhizosphaerae TaxID=2880967 RepID=A0ABN8ACP0_9BACI|nr:recombination regulator RecX [Sutcliffiella rhizosphaerae]CAG9622996.1 Regulatory protein RecX [Sutcliffiella rhizosphaerae]
MSKITKITVQQKNKARFNIFLDEEYAFAVYESTLLKYQLAKGKELDELDIEEILFSDQVNKAYNAAVHYLSFRMRTEKEVVDYLKEKEYEGFVIKEIIVQLKEQSYLNDKEFAIAYVRTQVNTTLKGRGIIEQELLDKGVDKECATEVLEVEYALEKEVEHAVKLVIKYAPKYSRDSFKIMIQKVESALLRKGYSYSIIKLAIEEAELEQDTSEEWEAIGKQAEKFHRKYKSLETYEYMMKMKGALYRKGFTIELIDKWLEEEGEKL